MMVNLASGMCCGRTKLGKKSTKGEAGQNNEWDKESIKMKNEKWKRRNKSEMSLEESNRGLGMHKEKIICCQRDSLISPYYSYPELI